MFLEHTFDNGLPARALELIRQKLTGEPVNREKIYSAYSEPVTAMHDDDIEFPPNIEYAYYSIYNLFRLIFVPEHGMEEQIVLNQAMSSQLSNQEDKNEDNA